MLRLDSKGFQVVDLQARLKWLYNTPIEVTGKFDEATDDLVRHFQSKSGLVIDGLVGKNTQGAIRSLTRDAWLYLFIHCSASPVSAKHVTGEWVAKYHMNNRGWSRPGYADFIELDGTLTNLRPHDLNRRITKDEYTWGVKGSLLNRQSQHLCYSGGIDEDREAADTRSDKQAETMQHYVKTMLAYNPSLIIAGHNQVQRKACPSFDVPEWCESIGIAKHNTALWNDNVKRYV